MTGINGATHDDGVVTMQGGDFLRRSSADLDALLHKDLADEAAYLIGRTMFAGRVTNTLIRSRFLST